MGRDEAENHFLARLRGGRWWFEVPDAGSPLVLAQGEPDPELRCLIASIAARYSSRRLESTVEVLSGKDESVEKLRVAPLADADLEQYRI